MLKSKHLIGLEHFPVSDLNKIIDTSFKFKDILQTESRKAILLKGKDLSSRIFNTSRPTFPEAPTTTTEQLIVLILPSFGMY